MGGASLVLCRRSGASLALCRRSSVPLVLLMLATVVALEATWTPASDGGPARFSKRHRDAAGIDDSRWTDDSVPPDGDNSLPPDGGILGWLKIRASQSISSLVIVGSFFNVCAHAAIALSFFVASESTATSLWQTVVRGSLFEAPGVGLYYAIACSLPEVWSALRFVAGAADATKRLIAFQVFVLGGGGAYHCLVLSSPRRVAEHVQQMLMFEWLFVAGMMLREDVAVASLHDALKVYAGCKCAGFLWAYCVAGALRACGLARLASEPGHELSTPESESEQRLRHETERIRRLEARKREYVLVVVVAIAAAYLS